MKGFAVGLDATRKSPIILCTALKKESNMRTVMQTEPLNKLTK